YYGCMLLRPRELAIDDPEDPQILEELLRALGVQVADSPLKTRCCGSYLTVNRKEIVSDLVYDILIRAVNEGADAVAVSCPLCAFNLDERQTEVRKLHPTFEFVPVFYFTQLMALAFGLDTAQCGFEAHSVDPRKLLEKKGLLERE
ncbi:MAG: heterodisulfide reductase-related iron-sulfur binding cluster, partial [bacterium]